MTCSGGLTRSSLSVPEKLDQARLLFERVLGYANHPGLYSEQTGPQGETLGNFQQAFTHLALISAAFNLDRRLGSEIGTTRVSPGDIMMCSFSWIGIVLKKRALLH